MRILPYGPAIAAAILLLAALPACQRAPEERAPPSENGIHQDVKDVARTTEKTATDLGHAAVGAADRASQGLSEATNKLGVDSQDAWITTKVKSELTSKGLDPLRVHVDTDGKVVTLSGTVDSAAQRETAVAAARAVKGVASVTDHLFIGPAAR